MTPLSRAFCYLLGSSTLSKPSPEDRYSKLTHHANEVTTTVLPDQLLLAVGLADDGTQTAVQDDVSAVRLIVLPV